MLVLLSTAVGCGGGGLSPTGAAPKGNVVDVTIGEYSFGPAQVTVAVGTTVRWTVTGNLAHSTVSDANAWVSPSLDPPGGGGGYGGSGGAGGTYSYTFNSVGTFGYHCALHPPAQYPGFVGKVIVTQ